MVRGKDASAVRDGIAVRLDVSLRKVRPVAGNVAVQQCSRGYCVGGQRGLRAGRDVDVAELEKGEVGFVHDVGTWLCQASSIFLHTLHTG